MASRIDIEVTQIVRLPPGVATWFLPTGLVIYLRVPDSAFCLRALLMIVCITLPPSELPSSYIKPLRCAGVLFITAEVPSLSGSPLHHP